MMRNDLYEFVNLYLKDIDYLTSNNTVFADVQKNGAIIESHDSIRFEANQREEFMGLIKKMSRFFFRLLNFVGEKTKEMNDRTKQYMH